MKNLPLFSVIIASLATASQSAVAQNIVQNPGFEAGKEKWGQFIPEASKSIPLKWDLSETEPHGGAVSAVMDNPEAARWALTPVDRCEVVPGEKYRVTAWIKFGDGTQVIGPSPGAYVRLVLLDLDKKDIPDPKLHLHVGLSGDVARSTALAKLNVANLPSGWQKLEAVVQIPPDVAFVGLNLMVQGVVGPVFWDDITLEPVPAETVISQVIE